ncbi:MAG: DOMON domain-containing protein [Thermoplasmatota archaeon]
MILFVMISLITVSIIPSEAEGVQDLDGVIDEGEYEFIYPLAEGDLKVHWTVRDDTIEMALEGKTDGWVSIGFGYTTAMKDSDMIFGWVDSAGNAKAVDTYSTGLYGPHPPDTENGGTDDIEAFNAKESGGWTVFEFTRKMDTGDEWDNPIPEEGTIDILWGMGTSDDFEDIHDRYGSGTLNISTGEGSSEESVPLWPIHAVFMTIGVLGMIAASISLCKRGWKYRLKFHMWVMTAATISAAVGLITSIYMVEESTGFHLRVLHSWLGLFTLLVAFFTLGMGFYFLRTEKVNLKKPLRTWHQRIGWVGVALMMITAVSGFLQAVVLS